MISVKAGPLVGPAIRNAADRDIIEALVADLAVAGPTDPAPSTGLWSKLTGGEDEGPPSPRAHLLDEVLADPLRELLWRRALFGATVTHAAVGAAHLEEKINRSTGGGDSADDGDD